MTVKIVRLITGEELICEFGALATGAKPNTHKITDVGILIPTTQNSLAIAPFMQYSDASEVGMDLKESQVMFAVNPHPDLLEQHRTMFGKIAVGGAGIIT